MAEGMMSPSDVAVMMNDRNNDGPRADGTSTSCGIYGQEGLGLYSPKG